MCRSKPKREKVSDAASALRTRAANVRSRKRDTAKEEKDIVHAASFWNIAHLGKREREMERTELFLCNHAISDSVILIG